MPLKLIVRSVIDPDYSEAYVYGQDRITIGRDQASTLVLPDEKRIISKEHAEIVREDDGLVVVDLGSKNFTYLNGTRLKGGQPADLDDGDVLRLGDFEVEVQLQEAPQPDPAPSAVEDDRTVFAFNPFWEDVGRLRDVLEQIQKVYARETPERRREALFDAVRDMVESDGQGEAAEVIGAALAGQSDRASEAAPAAPTAPPESTTSSGPGSAKAGGGSAAAQAPSRARRSAGSPPSDEAGPDTVGVPATALEALSEMLLEQVADLLSVPWQFRHEFIGQTIMQSEEAAVLYEGDAQQMMDYLVDPDLPEAELARRRELLEGAAESLSRHLVALIDGYRASAQQGSQHLLKEVDLEAIEQEVAAKAQWFEKPFVRFTALKLLADRVEMLHNEDWVATERRVFRPAFIKAYLARMTSTR